MILFVDLHSSKSFFILDSAFVTFSIAMAKTPFKGSYMRQAYPVKKLSIVKEIIHCLSFVQHLSDFPSKVLKGKWFLYKCQFLL